MIPRWKIGVIALGIGAFLLRCGGAKGPVPIEAGEDLCNFCRMVITDLRFAAEIIDEKGNVYKFDDIHCMIALAREKDFTPEKTRGFFVLDYQTKEWVRAEKAFFVKGQEIWTPMAGGVVAFKDRQAAMNLAREKGAKLVDLAALLSSHR